MIGNIAGRAWERAIGPHPRISGLEERRAARLFASIMLVQVALVLILLAVAEAVFRIQRNVTILDDMDIQAYLVGMGVILIAYGLLRAGYYRSGVTLYILLTLAIALVVPFQPYPNIDPAVLATAVVPILMTAIAFSPRWVAGMIGVIAVAGAYQLATVPFPPDRFTTLMALLFVDLISGGLILVYVVYQNGIERERRAQLQESEEKYRAFIQQTSEGIFFTDEQGYIIEWNCAIEEITGIKQSEALGTSIWEIQRTLMPQARVPPGNDIEMRGHYLESIHAGNAWWLNRMIETAYINTDGTQHPIEVRMFPIHTERGLRLGCFIRDITQRKQAQDALQQLNRELERRVEERTAALEAKNRELQTFSYSVSHDLKAPLRGIDGYSRLLQQTYASQLDEDGNLFLSNIRAGVARMIELIEGLLAYSRVEQRRAAYTRIDLAEFVARAVAGYAAGQGGRSVKYELQISCGPVTTDAQGLELILRNLVDNAVKFSQQTAAPRVEIGANEQEGRFTLWVRDNGVGFDTQHAGRIFEIFQRLHRAEEYPGSGVGLAIVRKAVERLGGRVWAVSQPGEGATFFVELPQAQGDPAGQVLT